MLCRPCHCPKQYSLPIWRDFRLLHPSTNINAFVIQNLFTNTNISGLKVGPTILTLHCFLIFPNKKNVHAAVQGDVIIYTNQCLFNYLNKVSMLNKRGEDSHLNSSIIFLKNSKRFYICGRRELYIYVHNYYDVPMQRVHRQ